MAEFDSADLLQRFKDTAQLGATYEGTSDAAIYGLLSNGQRRVAGMVASLAPWTNYGAPEALTTSDGGYTYTFTSQPIGVIEIREGRSGAVLLPAVDWDGSDGYLIEQGRVRWPNGRTRSFASGLYARYMPMPSVISAVSEPTLMPVELRLAVVYDAVSEWAMQGGYRDPAPFQRLRQQVLYGDPTQPGDIGLLGALRVQETPTPSPGLPWWRTGDFR
jgi:hypothetical protein